MTPHQLFNQLLTAVAVPRKPHEQHAPLLKCLETELVDCYYKQSELNPDWVAWLVATNNTLPAREQKESIKFVHELLRTRLVNYDKTVSTYSPYAQDIYFKRKYGFHHYSLILKHIHPKENLGMVQSKQYERDPAFAEHIPTVCTVLDEEGVNSEASGYFASSMYDEDEHFKFIVSCHQSRGPLPRLVAGIPYVNGGIGSVASIMIAGEANIQFMGYLDAHLDRACSAYAHGPIFMMFQGDGEELHRYNKYNPYVFDLPLPRLVFLVPNNETIAQLSSMLASAVEKHLISVQEMEQILANNVFTYEGYYALHSLKNPSRLNIDSIDLESIPTTETSPLMSRAASELIVGQNSTLSPLRELSFLAAAPTAAVAPRRSASLTTS